MSAQADVFDVSKMSVTRSMLLLAGGALLGLLIAGYGLFTAKGTRSRGVPAEAVALINQRPILRSDFMAQAQTEFTLPFAQTNQQQRKKVLTDMVNEELLMQRGLEIDLPSYDPDVRTALVAGVELEVTADVLAQQPTTAELRAFYDSHKDQYSSEGVVQLRDLVVARAHAADAVAALRQGQSVDAVMQRFSMVDSGRFVDAGHPDLGEIYHFAVHAKVDSVLEAAILPLEDGEISDPVDQSDGVHVVVMTKHRFPVAQSFDEAANRVWTDIKRAAQDKVRAANLVYLHSRADIIIAPDYEQ